MNLFLTYLRRRRCDYSFFFQQTAASYLKVEIIGSWIVLSQGIVFFPRPSHNFESWTIIEEGTVLYCIISMNESIEEEFTRLAGASVPSLWDRRPWWGSAKPRRGWRRTTRRIWGSWYRWWWWGSSYSRTLSIGWTIRNERASARTVFQLRWIPLEDWLPFCQRKCKPRLSSPYLFNEWMDEA